MEGGSRLGTNTTLAPGAVGKPRDLVFVSYSHTDRKWLDRLSIFLKPYIKQGRLNVWNDPYIRVGKQWRREISTALGRTCVGVLLVSPDFIASDFIQDEEVPPLFRGAEMGSIILFAIPISASAFKITPLPRYQWAHDPKQPLDQVPKPKRHAILVGIADHPIRCLDKLLPWRWCKDKHLQMHQHARLERRRRTH